MSKLRTPNPTLRYYRERQNWTQEQAAEALLFEFGPGKRGEINARMISRWERGIQMPSPDYREKLCRLYKVSSPEELGIIKREEVADVQVVSQGTPSLSIPLTSSQPLVEQKGQEWLTIGTSYLGQLFDEGWSIDEILDMSRLLLQAVRGMPPHNRLKLLEASSATNGSNISILTGNTALEGESIQFCSTLERSIGAAWRLFHTAGNIQVLAVGKTLLYIIQQNHTFLPSHKRNRFYSSVQNLIGKALHFQGRYEEAIEAHVNAHIAARGSGEASEVVKSLLCQANVYPALGQYSKSIQVVEEALCYLNNPTGEMLNRLKSHLLACWADNAMNLGDYATARQKLAESKALLDSITPNEEFDLASWFQLSGKHAFMTKDYETAIQEYEKALIKLPSRWLIRQVLILMPLLSAYTCTQNREGILAILEKSVVAIQSLNAPITNKYFVDTVQGVLIVFENDSQVYDFAVQALHQFS